MPGDRWQQFANLRLFYSFMWTHPGKKLLFMGCEFGQWREWDHDQELDWYLLRYGDHVGVQSLVRTLNQLHREEPALHRLDGNSAGFRWVIGDDHSNSVYAWLRHDRDGATLLVVHNFTPVPRNDYRIGVPLPGRWTVLLNSDDELYAGSGAGSRGERQSEEVISHGEAHSLILDLPPLGSLILKPLA
jgi:1,4-alpha-glucan branching enzyme